ncbi:hypothetical protein ZWY2020_025183 [Hordeum vulgare]|nr:hypothetical protein ZWY2020_025183 [Hordeum vulgare]
MFPINKEIHSFFQKSPLLPPQAPITRPNVIYPRVTSLFFPLPPFSSLLPLLHINQRSIVE